MCLIYFFSFTHQKDWFSVRFIKDWFLGEVYENDWSVIVVYKIGSSVSLKGRLVLH